MIEVIPTWEIAFELEGKREVWRISGRTPDEFLKILHFNGCQHYEVFLEDHDSPQCSSISDDHRCLLREGHLRDHRQHFGKDAKTWPI